MDCWIPILMKISFWFCHSMFHILNETHCVKSWKKMTFLSSLHTMRYAFHHYEFSSYINTCNNNHKKNIRSFAVDKIHCAGEGSVYLKVFSSKKKTVMKKWLPLTLLSKAIVLIKCTLLTQTRDCMSKKQQQTTLIMLI